MEIIAAADNITSVKTEYGNISSFESVPDSENQYLIAAKEVDTWILMGNPLPVVTIVALYLLFVKIGPEWMKNRQPMEIKNIMLVYNLYQALFNAYMVSELFTTPGAISYIWNHCCHPMDVAINPYWMPFSRSQWFYFFSKVMDLLDTVFFILRKKDSHVSFLHVYHHANMVILTWIQLKYIKGEQAVIIGFINASIHIVMYSYYFLSALGPEIQKYLWWKKYLTRMQIIQFVIIIAYMTSLVLVGCDLPPLLSYLAVVESFIFLFLFLNFYFKKYNNETSHKKE